MRRQTSIFALVLHNRLSFAHNPIASRHLATLMHTVLLLVRSDKNEEEERISGGELCIGVSLI